MTRRLPALLGALAIGLLAIGVPAPAQAAEDGPSVQVVLDALTPLVPTAEGTLRIRGRVISTARTALTNVSVQLRRSTSPLDSRAAVADIANLPMNPTGGDPDVLALPGTRTQVADTLAPGAITPFSIEIGLASLGLGQDGTYVLGVEALGRETGVDASDVRKADQRTFLPWFPDPGAIAPVDLVWLWPLADWPARTAEGILLNDRTPTELTSGGRLQRLLALGTRFSDSVSWVADPALLETARDMTGGYQVMSDGKPVLGDKEAAAERWLANLRSATAGSGLLALPYADVDASAVTRADMETDVVRSVTRAPGVATTALRSPVSGSLYWAPFGRLDRPTTNVLASAGVTTLILSSSALPVTDAAQSTEGVATAALPTSFGTMRAVLTDPGLTRTLSLPQRSASDVIIARQRFLAETAIIATTLPADQASRTVVVAPASVRWSPTASLLTPLLRATRSAPWLASTTLDELLTRPPSSVSRQRVGYGQKAREAELSPTYMAAVRRTTRQLNSFTSIIDDPTGISEPFSAALLRSESSAWRANPTTGEELVATIAADLADEMSRVHVLSKGNITFSGDTGRVPVTITNDLDRSVTVGLTLTGRPSLRLTSEPLTGIRIEPGKMASVDIDARVVGGDPLTVDVQLLNPAGEAYGKPARITLSSTAYARAAAWVVAAAFLAIAVFVVVGVTRRIRKAQAARTSSHLER